MKKFLNLILIICLLCSCSNKKEIKLPEVTTETGISIAVQHFVYKEHSYLCFCNKYNSKQLNIIHDPDCEYCFIGYD